MQLVKAKTPKIDMIDEQKSKELVEKYDARLKNDVNWHEMHDFFVNGACVDGQFGYQKTNDDSIDWPLIFLTEVHIYCAQFSAEHRYRAVELTVQIDEKTRKPLYDTVEYIVRDVDNASDLVEEFSTTTVLPSGKVVQYNNWYNLDDVIKARNDKLVEQGKFTQEQIDEMIKKDGYVHAMRTHRLIHKA